MSRQELIERLQSGNVYKETQAKQALHNFFTEENLTALRELALRRCADRVNILTENARVKHHGDYHTDEHILVCVSSSPSNAKIIRTAAQNGKRLSRSIYSPVCRNSRFFRFTGGKQKTPAFEYAPCGTVRG